MATFSLIYGELVTLEIYQGDDIVSATFTILNSDDSPTDFTGLTALTFTVYDYRGGAQLAQITNGAGVSVSGNVITLTVDYSTSFASLILNESHVFELKWENATSQPQTITYGNLPGQGYSGDGSTQYINTLIDMSTDLTNATQNDNYTGIYVYDNRDIRSFRYIAGRYPGSHRMLQLSTGNAAGINSSGTIKEAETVYADRSRYEFIRDGATSTKINKNGITVATGTDASVPFSSIPGDVYVGSVHDGAIPNYHLDATISYYTMGKGSEETNINIFLDKVKTEFAL